MSSRDDGSVVQSAWRRSTHLAVAVLSLHTPADLEAGDEPLPALEDALALLYPRFLLFDRLRFLVSLIGHRRRGGG